MALRAIAITFTYYSKVLSFDNFTKARLFRDNQHIYLLQMHATFGKHYLPKSFVDFIPFDVSAPFSTHFTRYRGQEAALLGQQPNLIPFES